MFNVKLGHFAICEFFLYVANMQACQQKTEKFFVSEEKSFKGSATDEENVRGTQKHNSKT